MTNRNKEKGSRWEAALVTFLRSEGFTEVARIRQAGRQDEGDLGGLRSFAIEAKDWAVPAWWEFIRQANAEAANAQKPFGVAIVKKRNAPTKDALVAMDLATFVGLLHYIESLGGRA